MARQHKTATASAGPSRVDTHTGAVLDPSRVRLWTSRLIASGPAGDVTAPATGRPVTAVRRSVPADVDEAFRRARLAAPGWAATPVDQRAAVLLRLHDLVLAARDELCELLTATAGKTRRDAFEEVADIGQVTRYYARTAAAVLAPRRRAPVLPGWRAPHEVLEPVGVVGTITPWNYPFTLGLTDGLAALTAGNTVVAMPDARVPVVSARIAALLAAAGLPDGCWNVVCGDPAELGPAVVDQADGIAFTGSTATGRTVAARCGERLIPAVLELGGKNAVIVLADVDVDTAVEITLRNSFADAGQTCVSSERVYVHAAIADRFVAALAAAARRMRVGVLADPDCEVGSLMDDRSLERVRAHVDDALACGARVLAGGRHRPDLGPFVYEPTVLSDVPVGALCARAETFGPVLAVYPVADADAAVAAVNDSDFGFHHVVLGRDVAAATAVADRLRAGNVSVNDGYIVSWAATDVPVGGWAGSGLGRRHGAVGLTNWTRGRTVAVGRRVPLAASGLRAPALERALSTGLRVLRRSGRR